MWRSTATATTRCTKKELLSCSQSDNSYDVLITDGIWIGEFAEARRVDPADGSVAQVAQFVDGADFGRGAVVVQTKAF